MCKKRRYGDDPPFYTLLLFFLVVCFVPGSVHGDSFFEQLRQDKNPAIGRSILKLSRKALTIYFQNGKTYRSERTPEYLRHRAGLFVTLTKNGENCGCMGSIYPTEKDLAAEVVKNTLSAAFEDPLHSPISSQDLAQIRIVVSITGNPTHIADNETRNPARFGLLVRSGDRAGVILPGEARTFGGQLEACKKKAGIRDIDSLEKIIFETVTFRE